MLSKHIRRDKATSNIYHAAQALLANMAGFWSLPRADGLKDIAGRIHGMANIYTALASAGYDHQLWFLFDTITVDVGAAGKLPAQEIQAACVAAGVNIRVIDDKTVSIAFGEAINKEDVEAHLSLVGVSATDLGKAYGAANTNSIPASLQRTSGSWAPHLQHP